MSHTPNFTPADDAAERREIQRAGGIRRWTRDRAINYLGGAWWFETDAEGKNVKVRPAAGERRSLDGRVYAQGPDGSSRRHPPKVRGGKKRRVRAARAATVAKERT